MKKAEIGIYKNYKEYFAFGISGYRMKEIKDEDKYTLAFKIRDKLNKKKIKSCFIRPFKNGDAGHYLPTKYDLEEIAKTISYYKNLEIKINNNFYTRKCQTNQ
ncbi:MAG: hypothetical protein Q8O84_00530 [Nanoarchaeota archaeon]|nr:hypothetical protein [Nanoarchaeota archaeon]